MEKIKIAVMGGAGAGKSALVLKYTQNVFPEHYDPTLEDIYRKHVDIDSRLYDLEILDTAGSGQFVGMRDIYIKNADGFILVYSMLSFASLIELDEIINKIVVCKDVGCEEIPIIICGTKSDLSQHRLVESDGGKFLADEWKSMFIETSSKKGQNVDKCFKRLCRDIIKKKNLNNK